MSGLGPGPQGPAPAGYVRRAAARLRWTVSLIDADLALLRSQGLHAASDEEALTVELLRLSALGGAAALIGGIALWLVSNRQGVPLGALLLAGVGAVLLPALRWLRFRHQADTVRAAIRHRLPRLLTGSRVLLESGALTPQRALTTAVAIYRDHASDVLREALRESQVQRVELQAGLDAVAQRYDLEPVRRLADAFRVGTRFGTEMAELLAGFAAQVRQDWHAEYHERMTRAPVLMTIPALVFFVLPLFALVLLLVVTPLMRSLSRL